MAGLPRVVIVGAGSIGERHIRCFLTTNRVEVAFVEPQAGLRGEIARQYPRAVAHKSFDEALIHPPDCVVIATPAPLHVPQAIRAIEHDCHVLIEKPLSVSTDGVARLRDLAESRSRTVAVAYVYRAHPALAEMRQAIVTGRFGAPLELVAVSGQHFPLYRPAYASTYYARHESGGGAIQDALTHVLNAGEWLVGRIDAVVADAARQRLETTNVEDTVHVLARQGRVLASYSLNQHQAPNESTITVVCEQGTTRFEYHANRWRSVVEPGGEWEDHPAAVLERDALFTRQANAFLNACFKEADPLCSLEEGIATLHVNQAVLKSVEKQAWQRVGNDA